MTLVIMYLILTKDLMQNRKIYVIDVTYWDKAT